MKLQRMNPPCLQVARGTAAAPPVEPTAAPSDQAAEEAASVTLPVEPQPVQRSERPTDCLVRPLGGLGTGG